MLGQYDNDNVTFAIADQHYSPNSAHLQSQTYQQAGCYYGKAQTLKTVTAPAEISVTRPALKGHQTSFTHESQQPAKKMRHNDSSYANTTSVSSVMANFFKNATSGYRVGRTPVQTAVVV